MGMFDYLKCEYPLPLPEQQGELAGRDWREHDFQTKSLECLMDRYCIREDGTLWQQSYAWGQTKKGRPRREAAGWQAKSDFTGTIEFGNFICKPRADYSADWLATFVAGKLTELVLLRWEEFGNRHRLESEARWKREAETREQFLVSWVGRTLYPAYSWLVHGCLGTVPVKALDWIGRVCAGTGRALRRVSDRLAPHGDPIRDERRRRAWEKWSTEWFDEE